MSKDVTNMIRWNLAGRDNTLHRELDLIRGCRYKYVSITDTATVFGSLSVPSGKILQLMRIEFLDQSATQSFGNILLMDNSVTTTYVLYRFYPETYTLGLSFAQHEYNRIYDFSPYGIPMSKMFNLVAHSKSACGVAVFFIERDKIPIELG